MSAGAQALDAPPARLTAAQRLRKLAAMSPRELWRRCTYSLYCRYEARAHARGAFARPDRLRAALRAPLRARADWSAALLEARHASRGRFFASLTEPARTRACVRGSYGDELERTLAIAADVRNHRIAFFGRTHALGETIDWHADPRTGRRWPVAYHRQVPSASGDVGFGDIKDVWELNRHQFFVDLAKSAFLTGTSADATELLSMLRSWIEQNPYGTGVNWSCALEPAFRSWSWLWSYYLILDDDALDAPTHLAWLTAFLDHGRFLHRHLEYDTSPYNHLAGEACALFMLGVLFPEFAEAASWERRGRQVLESRVGRQFHADGGSVEQSTFYHHATLGFHLMALIIGDRNGIPLSSRVRRAVERAFDFSTALLQPDGCVPAIGGADDGKPLRMEHCPFWDFRSYLAIGAVVFERGDLKFAAGRFWEDALWMLGVEGRARFDALEPTVPPTTRVLPRSGYVVGRSSWARNADYVCFDCGPQADGLRRDGITSAAHGHADGLSVVLWLGGSPVLLDSGFFCYNGDPVWEVHFRKTVAHNTVRVDGADQARHVSKMSWSQTYEARLDSYHASTDGVWALGSHDGFTRTVAPGILHRRTVWLREGYLVLLDEIVGTGTHGIELNYHVDAALTSTDPSGHALLEHIDMSWTSSTNLSARASRGGPLPSDGWVSTSLGVRRPVTRLAISASAVPLPASALTVIADRRRGLKCRTVAVEPGEGLLIAVAGTARVDIVHAPARPDGSSEAARLVIWRSECGTMPTQAAAAGVWAGDVPAAVARTLGNPSD